MKRIVNSSFFVTVITFFVLSGSSVIAIAQESDTNLNDSILNIGLAFPTFFIGNPDNQIGDSDDSISGMETFGGISFRLFSTFYFDIGYSTTQVEGKDGEAITSTVNNEKKKKNIYHHRYGPYADISFTFPFFRDTDLGLAYKIYFTNIAKEKVEDPATGTLERDITVDLPNYSSYRIFIQLNTLIELGFYWLSFPEGKTIFEPMAFGPFSSAIRARHAISVTAT